MSEVCGVCGRPDAFYEAYGDTCRTSIEGYTAEEEATCYRLGYQRTLARSDRYEAEFAACKALLIAEQKRAERAEAERSAATAEFVDAAKAAVPESEHPRDPTDWPWSIRLLGDDRRACYRQRDEAQRDLRDFKRDCDRMLEDAYQGGKRAEAAARALALREAAQLAEDCIANGVTVLSAGEVGDAIRALAALPVEPARRQVTENANASGAPSARSTATPEEERRRCKATTRRGWPCPAFVNDGLDYCYGHSAQRIRTLEAALATKENA